MLLRIIKLKLPPINGIILRKRSKIVLELYYNIDHKTPELTYIIDKKLRTTSKLRYSIDQKT